MKNRLIDLLKNIPKPPHIVNGMHVGTKLHTAESVAVYLIGEGVIVLPCKVGDTIYLARSGSVKSEVVEKMEIGKNNVIYLFFNWHGGGYEFIPATEFGKTAFLTHGEAARALKGAIK